MKYTHIISHPSGLTEKCNILKTDVYPLPSQRRYASVMAETGEILEVSHRNLIEIPTDMERLQKESKNVVELFCNFFKRNKD
jgi:hypothetical protein